MLDDAEGAIAAYERALELDPESAFTVDCLIELYEAKGDAARLVELYQRRVELATRGRRRAQVHLLDQRRRSATSKHLSDRPRAIDALGAGAGRAPGRSAACSAP